MSEAFTLDFVVMWAQTRRYLLITALASLFVGIYAGPFTAPFCISFTVITTILNLASLDDQPGWNAFRGSLPASRSDLVFGRYVAVLLVSVICWVTSLGVAFLCLGVGAAFPELVLSETPIGDPVTTGIMVCFIATYMELLVLFVCLFMLPTLVCMGQVKGLKWSLLGIALAIAVLFGIFSAFGGTDTLFAIMGESDEINFGALGIATAILAGITAVAFIASAAITSAAFARRDF